MLLRRLPLKGVHNLRDLGGYPAGVNKATRPNMLFRADGLFGLSNDDVDIILDYCKIKTVIDLRGSKELRERPNDFANIPGVSYINIPLISEGRDIDDIAVEWETLERGYRAVVRFGKSEIKRVFDVLADSMPNPVIFHCTAGKDRTGIVASLILGVCGVDNYDIISDYEVSYTYIKRDLRKMVDPGKEINMDFVVSPPEVMSGLLEFIEAEHGSILQFLLDCGVEEKKINFIKRSFLVDITL